MRVAVSGPPGSGKTTVAALVAQRLGYELVLVGQIFRKMAEERGVSLYIFGSLAEEDETIDKELDARTIDAARLRDDVVLEGRLTSALLRKEGIDALTVYIDAPEEVRAERIAGREGKDPRAVLEEMRTRERSERKRYRAYYGIDPNECQSYDLRLNSAELSPEQLADIIVDDARRKHDEEAREV